MKKIENFIFVLLIIIGLPIICTMVPTGPVKFMTVTGSSMEPTITDSDIVIVNTVKTQPEVGDIISYHHTFNENQSFIVTHRVVELVNEGYVTQGDAFSKPDGFIVAPEDVIGIMCFKIPYIGALVHFAGTIKGLLILVILPALILILQEVREIIGLMKKQK